MRWLAALVLFVTPMFAQAQLEGVIDLHTHSAPDSMARPIDALDLARMARRHGMRALVMKNHYTHTGTLAYMVTQSVPGIEIYGGIALNRAVGGINPVAIEHMANTTGHLGRIVWLPTFDSEHYHLTVRPNPDHVPIARDGALLPEVTQVFSLMADLDLALATGHSSPAESLLVIREARAAGIERIIVTHPTAPPIAMPMSTQQAAAELGALIEYPIALVLRDEVTFDEFAAQIRELGPEHVALTTDLGQLLYPVHTDGFAVFINRFREAGFSQDEVDTMTKTNPAQFLDLP